MTVNFAGWYNLLPWVTVYVDKIVLTDKYYSTSIRVAWGLEYTSHTRRVYHAKRSGRYYIKSPVGRIYMDEVYKSYRYAGPFGDIMRSL